MRPTFPPHSVDIAPIFATLSGVTALAWIIAAFFGGQIAVYALLFSLRRMRRIPAGSDLQKLGWWVTWVYCRLMHRPTYRGQEHVPAAGPVVVVSNHTSGLDPLIIATACPFEVRWMMAKDYMTADTAWFWRSRDIIPVERDGTDSGPAREAIRHVRAGGTVGIFPEGGIAKPPREVRPFLSGVGFIIAKAKAPVLLCWVSETPIADNPFGALLKPSRSRVEFVGLIDYSSERDPQTIAADLRRRLREASGWPLNDEPVPSARKRGGRDPFRVRE